MGTSPTNRPAWANATLDKLRFLGFNTIGTFSLHNVQVESPTTWDCHAPALGDDHPRQRITR